MQRPDEIDQTTEALPSLLEPRTEDRQSALIGRKQASQHHLFEEKQTDTLPVLDFEPPEGKGPGRQIMVLRGENKHLRSLLEQQRAELQQLLAERDRLEQSTDKALEISEHGLQQEIVHFQQRLQETVAERDRLQGECERLELRYQELMQKFDHALEEESQRQITQAAQALIETPEQVPVLLQDVARTIEQRLRQEEEKHLIETLYLKREILSMAERLEQERRQVRKELQHLAALQYSAREQADLRQKLLHERLHLRWKTASVLTSLGLLVLFVVMQFGFLSLFHVHLVSAISFALIAPVVVCLILSFVLASPLAMVRQIYKGAPRRKKAS